MTPSMMQMPNAKCRFLHKLRNCSARFSGTSLGYPAAYRPEVGYLALPLPSCLQRLSTTFSPLLAPSRTAGQVSHRANVMPGQPAAVSRMRHREASCKVPSLACMRLGTSSSSNFFRRAPWTRTYRQVISSRAAAAVSVRLIIAPWPRCARGQDGQRGKPDEWALTRSCYPIASSWWRNQQNPKVHSHYKFTNARRTGPARSVSAEQVPPKEASDGHPVVAASCHTGGAQLTSAAHIPR